MLTLTTTRLAQATLGTSTATLYTVPANTVTMLRNLFGCNSNGSARTWTIYLVKSGQSPADSNKLLGEVNIAGSGRDGYGLYQTLEAGDTIRGKASSASSIGVNISGMQITGDFGDLRPLRMAQALCTTSTVTVYTVPSGKQAIIKQLTFCNYTTGAQTVRVDVVKSGQSPSSSSQLYNALSIAANTTTSKRLSMIMDAGDTLRVSASAKNSIVVHASGVEHAL